MSNVLTASRGGVGPSQWLNHAWEWSARDPAGSFDTDEIDIYLDKIGAATPTRVTLTGASSGVSLTATTIAVVMTPTWVSANLSAGTWRIHFLVNKGTRAWWTQAWVTPDAGAFTP